MIAKKNEVVAKQPLALEKQAEMFDIANITKETIRQYICEKATDQEILMFIATCKAQDLSPLPTAREAYLVKYKDDALAQILTGYEVYLKKAEASKQYGGMKVWCEGVLEEGTLKGCVEIYRKDWDKPLSHEVDFNEYAQYVWDTKTKQRRLTKFWSGKPKTMIKKVAVSQGLRFAFPKEMDKLPFIQEEIHHETIEAQEEPEIHMPKEKEDDKQPQNTPQSLEDARSEAINVEVEPTPSEEQKPSEGRPSGNLYGEISREGIKEIIKLAKHNGYSEEDFKKYLSTLNYEKAVDILIQDIPTIVAYFDTPKADRTKQIEEDAIFEDSGDDWL